LKALQEIVGAAEARMAVALANIEGDDPRSAESDQEPIQQLANIS
jgi:hypothetical protein